MKNKNKTLFYKYARYFKNILINDENNTKIPTLLFNYKFKS